MYGLSLFVLSGGYFLGVVHELLIAVASLVVECRLESAWASVGTVSTVAERER